MKTLYIEANMGAAGDMLTAALVELFDDKEKIVAELNSLGIPDVTYTLSDSIKSAYHKCKKVIDSYGKRAQAAADNDGSDLKAISHCVRILFQVEELLETGKITFPLTEQPYSESANERRCINPVVAGY